MKGTFDLSILTWGGGNDSLYVIDEGSLRPVYTIDFNTKEVESGEDYQAVINENAPIHSYKILPGYFISDVSFPVKNEWGYTTGKPEYVITDRKTGESVKTTFVNDYMACGLDYANFLNGYWYTIYDPESFTEAAEKALKEGNLSEKNKVRIQEILKDLTPESNNILIIAPLKK